MGNYKFRLSDMLPNAWFYKLKDLGKGRHTSSNGSSKKKKQPKPKESSPATTTLPSKPKHVPPSHNHISSYPRKSYYFSRQLIPTDNNALLNLPDPPRRSSKHRTRKRTSTSSPKQVSAGCSCRASLWANNSKPGFSPPENYPLSSPDEGSTITSEEAEASLVFPPEFRSDRVLVTRSFDKMLSLRSPCKIESDSSNDIVIDVDNKSLACRKPEKHHEVNPPFDQKISSELDLPRIVTVKVTKLKEKRDADDSKGMASRKQRTRIARAKGCSKEDSPGGRRHNHYNGSTNSPGIRLRINSPRIAGRRSLHQVQGRKSLSLSLSSSGSSRSSTSMTATSNSSSRRSLSASSLAVVKTSFDPQKDFRESMVEMIVENNLIASRDLEDLLACYLSLNSDEYHDLIIRVFKQIWCDLTYVKSQR